MKFRNFFNFFTFRYERCDICNKSIPKYEIGDNSVLHKRWKDVRLCPQCTKILLHRKNKIKCDGYDSMSENLTKEGTE